MRIIYVISPLPPPIVSQCAVWGWPLPPFCPQCCIVDNRTALQTPSVVLWKRRRALLLGGPQTTCWEVRLLWHLQQSTFMQMMVHQVWKAEQTSTFEWNVCNAVKNVLMPNVLSLLQNYAVSRVQDPFVKMWCHRLVTTRWIHYTAVPWWL